MLGCATNQDSLLLVTFQYLTCMMYSCSWLMRSNSMMNRSCMMVCKGSMVYRGNMVGRSNMVGVAISGSGMRGVVSGSMDCMVYRSSVAISRGGMRSMVNRGVVSRSVVSRGVVIHISVVVRHMVRGMGRGDIGRFLKVNVVIKVIKVVTILQVLLDLLEMIEGRI